MLLLQLLLRLAATDCVAVVCCVGTAAAAPRLALLPPALLGCSCCSYAVLFFFSVFGWFCLPCSPPLPCRICTARMVSEAGFWRFSYANTPKSSWEGDSPCSAEGKQISLNAFSRSLYSGLFLPVVLLSFCSICQQVQKSLLFFSFLIRSIFALFIQLRPSRNSDPESHSGHSPHLPRYGARLPSFIARRVDRFLPPSTLPLQVDFCTRKKKHTHALRTR